MKNRLIAVVAAAALTFTSVAPTPAVALDQRDRTALTILLGAAALGAILSEANKDKRRAQQPARNDYTYYRDRPKHNHGNHYGWQQHGKYKKKHHGKKHDYYRRHHAIPAQCVFPIRGANGRRNVVSARCVTELSRVRDLPRNCAFRIRDHWGKRTVYGTQCLRNRGFTIASVR